VTVTAAGHGERLRDPEMPLEASLAGLRDGEECGPASIRDALAVGCADRIGHGIRALEDPDLVAELRERRIPLEWLDPPREVRPA
jgi:2,4-dienoyl-CoA reductase-like NADH-dependent reductase (Old Yellow Enzyme family)